MFGESFIKFRNLVLLFCLSALPVSRADAEWREVIENQTFPKGLSLVNRRDVLVRNCLHANTVTMGRDYTMETPAIGGSGNPLKYPIRLDVANNTLRDFRAKPLPFKNLPDGLDTSGNKSTTISRESVH